MYEDVKLETSFSLFSAVLRGEYQVLQNWYLPYLSVDLLANYFNESKLELDFDVLSTELVLNYWWRSAYLYSSGVRIGAGVGMGYSFDLFSNFVLDVHANYSIFNLLGKKAQKNLSGENRNEINLESINFTISFFYRI